MLTDSATYASVRSKLNASGQLNDYLTIRAPYSDIVTQRIVDPGTLVGSGSAKPMLVIENNRALRLRLAIPEAYTASNPENASVSFTVYAYPGRLFEAKLSRKSGALNLTNRTETWGFMYPNKGYQVCKTRTDVFCSDIGSGHQPGKTFCNPGKRCKNIRRNYGR